MENPLLYRIIGGFVFLLAVLLLVDGRGRPVTTLERFDRDSVKIYRASGRMGTEPDYWIVSASGRVIPIPDYTSMSLEHGDTFYLARTWLFKKQMRLTYPVGGRWVSASVELFRGTVAGAVICVVAAIVGLINVRRRRLINNQNVSERLLFFTLMGIIVFAMFYLV